MRFLAPIALAGLSLLLLPVAIHLLVRRRAKLVDFPSLKFLRATRSHQWSPRQLQQPLLLAVRLLGLALLLLGLAQPFRTSAESRSKLTVLLLDASFSMRAGQRAQAAREQALTFIDRMPANERAAVIAFDGASLVLAEPTADRKTLRDAVNRYQPGSGPADYVKAVSYTAELLKGNAAGETAVMLISDFQASGLPDEFGLRAEVARLGVRATTVAVGTPVSGNSYWTNLRARRGDSGWEVSATETTSGADGLVAVERTWKLSGPAGEQPGINWRTEANGELVGQLHTQTPDSTPNDDQLAFAFNPPRPRAVLVISDGTDSTTYLRAALTANLDGSNSREVVLAPEIPDAGESNQYGLLVLTLHGRPNPETLSRALQFAGAGGTVWFLAGDDLNTEAWNEFIAGDGGHDLPFAGLGRLDPATQPRLQVVDALAPAVNELTAADRTVISSVPFRTGYALSARSTASVSLRWSNAQPAVIQAQVGHGSIVVSGTSPERASGGFGLSPVFPQLAGSILATSRKGDEPLVYSIGEVPTDLVSGAVSVVNRPNGTIVSLNYSSVKNGAGAIFDQPGIYRIGANGLERFVAFRPPPPESEAAVADPELVRRLFAADSSAAPAAATQLPVPGADTSSWWRILAGLGFILLCIEALVAVARHRRSEEVVAATN